MFRKKKHNRDMSQSQEDTTACESAITGNNSEANNVARENKQAPPLTEKEARMRRHKERIEMLARPKNRCLQLLWDEKCPCLPRERRDKIKSTLEEEYFLTPEQTEKYFLALNEAMKHTPAPTGISRKEQMQRDRELRLRQKWLVNFSVQVAYKLCDYIEKERKEILVSNRLRSIADVVLERVADILGEPKPARTHPGRLPRFMVAISDRIAVWIENAVYRADAVEPEEVEDVEHKRLDVEKPLVY